MSKINVLSSNIFNRIAAGEVVERPYSVVKELVENSIDAGADKIKIEIVNGGKTSIVITDNGCGIESEELKNALLPHATSKISCIDDLDNILTLGFRGEALASIASVSKIEIVSKPAMQENGASISVVGGKINDVVYKGVNEGTKISVNDLFFNTPARQKFCKSDRAEEADVSNIVSRFILGNPNIAFEYYADDKLIYQSFGDGLEEAMIAVYGAKIIENCFNIEREKNGLKIKGYVSKHHFTKPNRTYQSLFVNGRYVINSTISSAIQNAYSSYLMKRNYPFYVLFVDLPSEFVDVNVHPNKTDVRFANNQIVYGAVYSAVSKVLDGTNEALSIIKDSPLDKKQDLQQITDEIFKDYATHKEDYKPVIDRSDYTVCVQDHTFEDKKVEEETDSKEQDKVDVFKENKAFIERMGLSKKSIEFTSSDKKEDVLTEKTFDSSLTKEKTIDKVFVQDEIEVSSEIKIIGQALNTYIIIEKQSDLYFIDQHAAHERLLFDRLIEKINSKEIVKQPLLIPFVLNLNSVEAEYISSKLTVLQNIGIEIEEFGRNSFKVSAVPCEIDGIDLGKFFGDIVNDLGSFKEDSLTDSLRDMIASRACKAAIKSGDKLDEEDVKHLMNMLNDNLGLKCPHGRPVAIKITKYEIDKWFKRII